MLKNKNNFEIINFIVRPSTFQSTLVYHQRITHVKCAAVLSLWKRQPQQAGCKLRRVAMFTRPAIITFEVNQNLLLHFCFVLLIFINCFILTCLLQTAISLRRTRLTLRRLMSYIYIYIYIYIWSTHS